MTPYIITASVLFLVWSFRRGQKIRKMEKYKALLIAKMSYNIVRLDMYSEFLKDCITNYELDRGDIWAATMINISYENEQLQKEIESL